MTNTTQSHHRPTPRTAYLLGRPATQWIDAYTGRRAAGTRSRKAEDRHAA